MHDKRIINLTDVHRNGVWFSFEALSAPKTNDQGPNVLCCLVVDSRNCVLVVCAKFM